MQSDNDVKSVIALLPPPPPPLLLLSVLLQKTNPIPIFDDRLENSSAHCHIGGASDASATVKETGARAANIKKFEKKAQNTHEWCLSTDAAPNKILTVRQNEKYTRYRGKSVAQILAIWVEDREHGDAMHQWIHAAMNGHWLPDSVIARKEIRHYFDFNVRFIIPNRYVPFRSELTVFFGNICGRVDALYSYPSDDQDKKNMLCMIDWKYKKELFMANGTNGSPEDEDDVLKFTKQLNKYRAMIEASTKYHILEMFVVLLHHDNTEPIKHEINRAKVDLDEHIQRVANQ